MDGKDIKQNNTHKSNLLFKDICNFFNSEYGPIAIFLLSICVSIIVISIVFLDIGKQNYCKKNRNEDSCLSTSNSY